MTDFIMPPRAFADPELYRQILLVYTERLSTYRTADVVKRNPEATRLSLRQLGVEMSPGGSGQNRRTSFERDNPPEKLEAIHQGLESVISCRRSLEDKGQSFSALTSLVQKIASRAFTDTPQCDVHEYLATLVLHLDCADGSQVAHRLDVGLSEVNRRLVDMYVKPTVDYPTGFGPWELNRRPRLHLLVEFLRLAAELDPKPA